MKQEKAKVGRPRLPKGQALGKPTPIRFQDDERAMFEKAAKREGLTLSEWVRQTLKNAIKQ
jgi:hypothetical protein